MKFFIAFVCLVASISAVPYNGNVGINFNDERFVTGSIISAVEDASQSIRDAGLDPLYIKREGSEYALPVPVIFNYVAFVEELLFTGLSNIKVNQMSFSVLTSRLNFDIELPLIELAVGHAQTKATVLSKNLNGQISGKVVIERIRVRGNVRVYIGIISGIAIRSVSVDFTLNEIKSDLHLVLQGVDYSQEVNDFLGVTVHNIIKNNSKEINQLLEIVLKDLINEIL